MILNYILILFHFMVFSQITFSGNWEKGITGNGNWKSKQTVSNYSLQRITDIVRQGQYAARVEVRPGDDPINSSGERSEVLIMTDANGNAISENESSGTQYYAFSVRLDSAWKAPAADANGTWAIIFQLHGPDVLGTSPSVAVSVLNGFSISLHSGDLDSPTGSLKWKDYPLNDRSLNAGRWVDLILKIKFAKDFTGSVTVWRRNEGQTDFTQVLLLNNVPTLQYKSSMGGVGNHYWKHGLYRSKQTSITNTLWLDGLTRGNTYSDAECAAFGCNSTGVTNLPEHDSSIMIYPNPFTNGFTVRINPHTDIKNMILKIYDVCGKEVRDVNIEDHEIFVESGKLPGGLYFYKIYNDNKNFSAGQLIVQ